MVVASTSAATPCPEFMWCQRSDRVYVTIKVADCTDAEVNVTPDMVLTFSGTGHGMCGRREYKLEAELGAAVVPEECCWFASGPSVRVRLQKANVGPYWAGLLAGKRKMPQLKVDWASWLDEDEENERSTAPNGFDVSEMKMQLVGSDKDPLYRDLDRFDSSTSPDEGEEMNSILIDEGESKLADVNLKMKALDYEKEEVAKARARRFELRKRTREAQLAQQQRERDLRFGRPVATSPPRRRSSSRPRTACTRGSSRRRSGRRPTGWASGGTSGAPNGVRWRSQSRSRATPRRRRSLRSSMRSRRAASTRRRRRRAPRWSGASICARGPPRSTNSTSGTS